MVMLIGVGVLAFGTGCSGSDRHYNGSDGITGHTKYDFIHPVMGINARLTLHALNEQSANDAAEAVFARFQALDHALSDWNPESETSRLGDRAGGEAVSVSEDLFHAVEISLTLSAATDGAFDITVGPMVQAWRAIRRHEAVFDASALQALTRLVGARHIQIDSLQRSVRLAQPGMRLDFGGIGKGLAADEAAIILRERGIDSFLIDLGGDVVVGDAPPGRAGWMVRLEAAGETVTVSNLAIATSGAAESFTEIDGIRYSHLVDPRTGLGVTHHLTVTVFAPSGTEADALASAVSVLGRTDGAALLMRPRFRAAAVIVGPDEQGRTVITRVGDMGLLAR